MTQILNAEFLRAFLCRKHEIWFRPEARTSAHCDVVDIEFAIDGTETACEVHASRRSPT